MLRATSAQVNNDVGLLMMMLKLSVMVIAIERFWNDERKLRIA